MSASCVLHIPASTFYIQMGFSKYASAYCFNMFKLFFPAPQFACLWNHNGCRNFFCLIFPLSYVMCFVSKVTWELIIWHFFIFCNLASGKLAFNNFDILWIGYLTYLLLDELVICWVYLYWIHHSNNCYHLIDLEPVWASPWDPIVHVLQISDSVTWNSSWWKCLDHRNLVLNSKPVKNITSCKTS